MKKVSYDVCIAPMTNIEIKVKDPLNPTEKEIDSIIEIAQERISASPDAYIIGDNIESIELYDPKSGEKKLIFALDMVHLTDEQAETLSDIFHEYKDYNRNEKDNVLRAMELEKLFVQITGGKYQPDTTYDVKE